VKRENDDCTLGKNLMDIIQQEKLFDLSDRPSFELIPASPGICEWISGKCRPTADPQQ
jgi:hypothetical protein